MAYRKLVLLFLFLVSGCAYNRDTGQLGAVMEALAPIPVLQSKPSSQSTATLAETKSKTPEKVTLADISSTQGNYQILAPDAKVAKIVIVISEQKLNAFDQNGGMIFWERVSTAFGGKTIPVNASPVAHNEPHDHIGEFNVFKKDEHHISGAYGCPMPYSLFYFSGHAIHQTERKFYNLLGSPASHGCIREGPVAAKWLFDHTLIGTQVSVIENVVQPLPPVVVKAQLAPVTKSDAGVY